MNSKTNGASMTFTTEQLTLQSFIESGLIPAWRLSFATNIALAHRPTPKQLDWVKKIVEEALNAPEPEKNALDFSPIFKMFEKAKNKIKWPKVVLQYPDKREFKMSIAGSTARHPGAISLVLGGMYVGRINLDSTVFIGRDGKADEAGIKALLAEFNKDPARVAAEHGKLLSSCCFCRLPLRTQESLAVGYGPDCANSYGLPWGTAKVTKAEILDLTEKDHS